MSQPSYVANQVPASVAYGENFPFVVDQFKIVPTNYKFTLLERKCNKVFWKNESSFNVSGRTEKYTVYGTGFVDNNNYKLNGSGIWISKFKSPQGNDIDITFTIYQNLTAKKSKGCLKVVLTEDGSSQRAVIDGKVIDAQATYALASDFKAHRV